MTKAKILLLLHLMCLAKGDDIRHKRGLLFPSGSLFGVFLAIAAPLDIPDKNVFVSYNFEANYAVVSNITQIDEVLFPNLPVISSRHARSLTRELTYNILEISFKEQGISGRQCLLRNICEAAETPLTHNGVLGHLLHIIFTPSTSEDESLDDAFYEAEAWGKHGDCSHYEQKCPFSLFDIITQVAVFQNK